MFKSHLYFIFCELTIVSFAHSSHSFFFFFFLFGPQPLEVLGTEVQNSATAATQATAVTMADP